MPSFLNKVFGHKKHDDNLKEHTRDAPDTTTLLDGKYEAVPPVSPSVFSFPDAQPTNPDRDTGFTSLFKHRPRGLSQKSAQKNAASVPHLTLRLPAKENSDSRTLGVVFDPDSVSHVIFDDAVIAARRLNPVEALTLIRACALTITERGLETLGIMHPHWFSSSPDVQRKLISLFIHSLTPQSKPTTLPPSTPSTSAFEKELHYTRSPHDVAAVLRWGLRHLTLEGGHFGKSPAKEWVWYNTFFHAEQNASYPPKAFSDLLLPQLPGPHTELLIATIGLISSLASHAETNGISGSKLSKFLGVWLLVATRAEESDDWNQFYARWERAGRVLEHLFLAHLREESLALRLPTRLQELVENYPYSKVTEDHLFPRPRFSTRQHNALCVRVESVLTRDATQPKQNPIQLLFEAFQLPLGNPSSDEHIALWHTLKSTAFGEPAPSSPGGPQFARIFVDETMQLLSLVSAGSNASSPTLLTSPVTEVISRRRSPSFSRVLEFALSKSKAANGSTPVSPTSPTSPVVTDWAQFSLSGFGDTPTTQPLAVAFNDDDDVEITQPPISPGTGGRRGKSRSRRRRSEEREPSDTVPPSRSEPESSIVETKVASVNVVQIDEAFIDFWSDAIVDPISSDWPTFVLCGLREISSAELPIRWLVLEQTYSRQEPTRNPSPDGRRGRSPRPSFKSDISGFRINSMFSSARKRFSVFSKSTSDLDPKRSGGKTTVTGELGEVLVEEEPVSAPALPNKVDQRDENGAIGAIISNSTTTDVADQLKVDEIGAHVAPVDPLDLPTKDAEPVRAVAEVTASEPAPQSGAGQNGLSVLALSVESPPTFDLVVPRIDIALRPPTENHVAKDGQAQQDVIDAEVPHVTLSANADEPLSVEPSVGESNVIQLGITNDSRGVAETVAMPPAPESLAEVVAAANPVTPSVAAAVVDDKFPGPVAKDPRVDKQPSREALVNITTPTAESVGQDDIHHLALLSGIEVGNNVIATEAPPPLEPAITSDTNGAEEAKGVAEPAEIPTPAPECVALVEETPGPEVDVDGRTGTAHQVPTTQTEAIDDAVPQPVATESQPVLGVDEASITQPAEAPSAEPVQVIDTRAEAVPIEVQPAADQVSESVVEEARPYVQGTDVEDVVEALPAAPEEEIGAPEPADAVLDVDVPHVGQVRDIGVPTPVVQTTGLVDETPGPETATEEYFDAPLAIAPKADGTAEPVVQATPNVEPAPETDEVHASSVEAAPSAQVHLAEHLPTTGSLVPQAIVATTVATAVDEFTSVKAEEAQPTRDLPVQDLDAPLTPSPVPPVFAPIVEDAPEIPAGVSVSNAIGGDAGINADLVAAKAAEVVVEAAQVDVTAEEVMVAPCSSDPVGETPTAVIHEEAVERREVGVSSAFVAQSADVDKVVDVEDTRVAVDVHELEISVTGPETDEVGLTASAVAPEQDVVLAASQAVHELAGAQQIVDGVAEQLVTVGVDVPTQKPSALVDEVAPGDHRT